MPCNEDAVYSNEYYDLIIDYNLIENYIFPDCLQSIDARFKIGYYPRAGLPALSVADYSYSAIPQMFALTDYEALEVTNILFLQNQPVLDLKGEGVMIGFVDTGIDYDNPVFRNEDGSTRIAAIWDQTLRGTYVIEETIGERVENVPINDRGNLTIENNEANIVDRRPQGFLYGREFSESEINQALASDQPFSLVESRDDNGHGTFLAGVACGGGNPANNFIGAAPLAKIAVVKCKEAKKNLKDYYFVPEGATCFQENDIMAGIAWLNQQAEKQNMPLVVCVSMGSSLGSHTGGSPLSQYINNLGLRRGKVITVSAGNEANARHHFQNRELEENQIDNVEISVERGVAGFVLELWATAPNLYQVGVLSPTGELFEPMGGAGVRRAEHFFLFENTEVSIEYDITVGGGANQLAFLRFTTPLQGLWTIRVTARQTIRGGYNMWLPQSELMSGNVFFLRSTPDITATTPSFSIAAVSTGAFLPRGNSLYPESGRGFGAGGEIKPDLAAPGVNVTGPDQYGNFTTMTGTSVAAAITAGACAQLLEWGIVKGRYTTLNSVEMRTILTRGARRSVDRTYPNPEWGFGSLDVFEALNQLRSQRD